MKDMMFTYLGGGVFAPSEEIREEIMAQIPSEELIGRVGSPAHKEAQRAKNIKANRHLDDLYKPLDDLVGKEVRVTIADEQMQETLEDLCAGLPSTQTDILEGAEDERSDPLVTDLGYIPFAYHLVPPRGLAKVAAVMRAGERKGRGGWDHVPIEEHINHAISHLVAYLGERRGKHHLANAGCRVLMALDLDWEEPLPEPTYDPIPNPIPKPTSGRVTTLGEDRPLDQYDREIHCRHGSDWSEECAECGRSAGQGYPYEHNPNPENFRCDHGARFTDACMACGRRGEGADPPSGEASS